MQAIQTSDIPLAYKLEGIAFVTSLPYADEVPERDDYQLAKKLVQAELVEMQKGATSCIDLEVFGEEIETPRLNALAEESLGKRSTEKPASSKKVQRDEYERAVIESEQLKDRYGGFNLD